MEDSQGVHTLIRRLYPRSSRWLLFPLLAASLFLLAPPSFAQMDPERQLMQAFDDWQEGRIDDAWRALERLVKREPNFRLAQLLYGEMLSARAGAPVRSLLVGSSEPEITELVEEARLRLRQWRRDPSRGALPDAVVSLSPGTRHAIVVDLPNARLYVLENSAQGLRVVRNFYAGMGRAGARKQVSGDYRTPVGVYRVTSFLNDDELPELYGAGAFPVDYPNIWDQRLNRTGSGIWIHGVPRQTYNRAPRSSEGCVTLANSDLLALKPYVKRGRTPVVFTDTLSWLSPDEQAQDRADLLQHIEHWRSSWSARDTETYLGFYADDFETDGMGKAAFTEYKRRVNAAKSFIEVKLSDMDVFRYPGHEPMMLARFRQDYRSDNFSTTSWKAQYWRRGDDGRWKIVKEGAP